jgi:nucleotide-binding universal stress UspA family protein
MKKILCAVDDCEHSKGAARLAGALAAAANANLTLLAVNELIGGYTRRDASARLWSPPQIRTLLEEAAAEAKAAGAEKIETVSAESRDVARAISQYAEEHGHDHIVVGSGGKSAVKRMVLGSVSADIVNRAPCPVTVAR